MGNPENITLDGSTLTIEKVIQIAYKPSAGKYAHVSIDSAALQRVAACSEFIRKKAEDDNEVIYGVTTGFGSKADTPIDFHDAKILQKNLLRSHAVGVGPRLSVSVTRAMMAIRLNTLLQGHSGVQVITVELLRDFLNNQIHPVVPSQGSVGASGDLCPLSHLALPLLGEGEVSIGDEPQIMPALTALEKKSLKPIELSYKEGLALNNGTTLITSLGVLAVHEAKRLLKLATYSSAVMFEALCARSAAFAYEPIHDVRNHEGQKEIARWLRELLSGSSYIDIEMQDILDTPALKELARQYPLEAVREQLLSNLDECIQAEKHKQKKFSPELYKCIPTEGKGSEWKDMLKFAEKKFKPQDSYSVRCLPQVFGGAYAAIEHVEQTIALELNAAVDNPLLFLRDIHGVENDEVISGGNFHGEPIGLPLDYLKLAVSEIGSIVERQINKLMDSATNDGLPSFLINGGGLNSGLMIVQYAAAAVASENKVLVHPATADSIPTCENTEDHVSMAPIAGRQALEIIENVKKIVAIAILTGYQAVAMREQQFEQCGITVHGAKPALSPKTQEFVSAVAGILREKFSHGNTWLEKDRYLSPEIHEILEGFPMLQALAEKNIYKDNKRD